jgi:hypothetical protein
MKKFWRIILISTAIAMAMQGNKQISGKVVITVA